jgi:hypothetical protein
MNMSFSQSIDRRDEQSNTTTDFEPGNYDEPTVDCYRRRNQILSHAHRTEWWMAIAVLALIASVGFVVL